MTSPDFLTRTKREIELRGAPRGFSHHEMRYCRHDQRMVRAIGPSPAWRWLVPVIGVTGFLAVIAVLLVDPFGIFALLAAIVFIAALGPTIALARREPRCPLCGREVPYHTREQALAADRREEEARATG